MRLIMSDFELFGPLVFVSQVLSYRLVLSYLAPILCFVVRTTEGKTDEVA